MNTTSNNNHSKDFTAQVAEFHSTFQQPILQSPEIPASDRAALRVSLIREELNELEEAIKNNDLVEVADALCDLQYVLSGTILEFGFEKYFPELFAEVHRSNMSKACSSEQEAHDTQLSYADKGIETVVEPKNGKFPIYRRTDNKVLKSINYSPAKLKMMVESISSGEEV